MVRVDQPLNPLARWAGGPRGLKLDPEVQLARWGQEVV